MRSGQRSRLGHDRRALFTTGVAVCQADAENVRLDEDGSESPILSRSGREDCTGEHVISTRLQNELTPGPAYVSRVLGRTSRRCALHRLEADDDSLL